MTPYVYGDANSGELLRTLVGHWAYLISLAFSPDGSILASGSEDDVVRLWHTATGLRLDFLYGHAAGVESIAFHPDGEILASGSRDDSIRIWDVASGRTQIVIREHEGDALSVDFNFDGSLLASGSQDRTIRLWDPTTGDEIRTLNGHEGGVRTLKFSPDGRTIASGSRDNTVRVWNVASGELMNTFAGHTSGVRSVAFSPDGSIIASGGWDGTVLIWDAPILPPEVIEEPLAADLDGDGMVDIADLALVASAFGESGENLTADVNGDGEVDIADLVVVAGAFGTEIAASPVRPDMDPVLNEADVRQWLKQAQQLGLTDPVSLRGILILEQLLVAFRPTETALLANYPNPFNPETWIPYHLAEDADVQVTIYDANGTLVRHIDLGHQSAGYYANQRRAAYWDGNNQRGEAVASGVYFYTLSTAGYVKTRKMTIQK